MASSNKVIDIDLSDMINKAKNIQDQALVIKNSIYDISVILNDMGDIWDANGYKTTMEEYNTETINIMNAINYFKCTIPNAMVEIANVYNAIEYGEDKRYSYKNTYYEEKNNIEVSHPNLKKDYDDAAAVRNIDLEKIEAKLMEIDSPFTKMKNDVNEIINIVEKIEWNRSIEAENFKRIVKAKAVNCYDYLRDYYTKLCKTIISVLQTFRELENQKF